MSYLITLPFNLSLSLTRTTLHLAIGRLGFLSAGLVLGWFSHKRYGNKLTEGVSADLVALWRTLDKNGDGRVTLKEVSDPHNALLACAVPGRCTGHLVSEYPAASLAAAVQGRRALQAGAVLPER